MSTMMQCYPSQTFVDDAMKPLVAGRLTVYKHDSNVLADIYTLEGADYVPCANPVRLDEAGRLVASIFTELGVYDVRLDKYNGDDTFEDFDCYEIGIDAMIDQIGRDSVKDVEALMNLDPSVVSNIVTVESYPVRNYLWDPDAIDTPDSGVVVGSDVSPTGRWLLLWESPYLSSAVYGVQDGDTTNINALFSYPEVIGSMNIHTPPAIRLLDGNYDLPGYLVCTKHLALEPNVTFTGTIGLYDDLELFGQDEPRHAIGDFEFVHSGCKACSWWYDNVEDFWFSGADIFVVDDINYFTDSTLRNAVNLANKVVIGHGTKVSAYANSGKFIVEDSTDIPERFFTPTYDKVSVKGSRGDTLFSEGSWDVGYISQGHMQEFSTDNIDAFLRTKVWYDSMTAKKNQLGGLFTDTLDFQGRTCNFRPVISLFKDIKNVTFGAGLTLTGSSITDFVLTNVTCGDLMFAGRYLTVYSSIINFSAEPDSMSSMWCYDSRVNSDSTWSNTSIQVAMNRCFMGISLNRAPDNKVRDALISLVDCTLMDNTVIKSKNLSMRGCTTNNCTIKVYPYYDTATSTYKMLVDFVGNKFVSTVPVEFTKLDGGDMGVHDQCYDVECNWNIVGNTFLGNTDGIRCRYFTNRSNGNVYNQRFVAAGSDKFIVNYSGNVGQCPQEDRHGFYLANWNKDHETYTIDENNLVYCYYGASIRAMPVYNYPSTDNVYAELRGRMQTARRSLFGIYSWADDGDDFTIGMGHPGTWQIDTRGTQPGDNGDFFNLGLSTLRVDIPTSLDVRGL